MDGNTSRFTYRAEVDEDGNIIGIHLVETAGYFAGRTPGEIAALAENLYPEFHPEFKKDGMQQEFYDIHFNHCLRRLLNDIQNQKLL